MNAQAPVVRSLLETDLYKFPMWQAMLHHMPGVHAEYRFHCRNVPRYPLARLKEAVEQELDRLCGMRFLPDELLALSRRLRFLKEDFIEFLRIFRFRREFITVDTDGDQLVIVAKGPQVHIMGFEIYVLYIVNELYYRQFDDQEALLAEGRARLRAKIDKLKAFRPQRKNPFVFFDFGLRRRFSGAWHEEVVATLKRDLPEYFKGTSNVYLALKHDLTPIGTMAHEYLQTFQAIDGVQLRHAQKAALETWVQEYRGDLGIALTDVICMRAFEKDFDLYFAKLFDGLRHDSGDPFVWGERAIKMYERLRIDPQTKRLVFSNQLDEDLMMALYDRFADRTFPPFGVGTHLTNDMGEERLNIVMKLVSVNGQPVAKLSDSPGKTMCEDETFLAYLRQVYDYDPIGDEA